MVYSPEAQRKVAQYLRMMERRAPVWDREKFEREQAEKKEKDGIGDQSLESSK